MNFFGYFIVGILCCCTIVSSEIRPLESNNVRKLDSSARDGGPNYRLPNNTIPQTYDITLTLALESNQFDFNGTVKIQIKALETTSNITLHMRQLSIATIKLEDKSNNQDIDFEPYTYDTVTEFVIIPTQLEKDKIYLLTITYMGELRTDNHGFYRSSYVNANSMTRWLATTQFESTDARHAFPCYDEPALKANFTIHIVHGTAYNAISNMNGTAKATSAGKVKTDFATTPPTSTYLIAFIVSDFGYVEKNISNDNPVHQRVYTGKNKLSQTAYALSEGVNILNAIAKYVSVPFTLPKMDQAAIPDFAAGAMENWGLVTYREPYLLYDENVHLPTRQLTISTIIAHEYGHQWFGNLVSPKNWGYIWLNEGFATLFEYLGAGLVHPEWNITNHYFVASKLQPVFRVDAKANTRAMTTYAESPSGISALFDNIAYAKSGSVIRMFLHALGEDTFKKGLSYYLTARAYNASDDNNLFDNLDKAAKEDSKIDASLTINSLFGSWSNQKGFPVLKVARNDNGSITLYQEKYDAVYKPNETDSSLWWIPFNFASASNPVFNVTAPFAWMPNDRREYLINKDENSSWMNDDWVIFNRQQTSFYRVWYDEKNYNLINTELNTGNLDRIHEINRAQYIDDLNDLVNTGRVQPKLLFNALTYLKKEIQYAAWVSARRAILDLNQIYAASGKLEIFKKFVADIVTNLYDNKTLNEIENEGLFDKLLRNIAVDLACQFGVEKCLNETYTQYQIFIEGGDKPSLYNRGVIFANGIRSATNNDIDKIWEFFCATTDVDERSEIINSFGNIPNSADIQRYLNKTIDDPEPKVTKTDRLSIIQSISAGSQNSLNLTIVFLTNYLDAVNATIGSVNTILTTISTKIVTADVQTKFFALLELAKNKGFCSDTDVDNMKTTVNDKIIWQKTYLEQFEAALPKDGPNSAAQITTIPALLALMFCLVRWNAE